jgi:hypothetical protein
MKRREFIRTSVGAGFVVALPNRKLFRLDQARASRGTMFDKIWDQHVISRIWAAVTTCSRWTVASAAAPTSCGT